MEDQTQAEEEKAQLEKLIKDAKIAITIKTQIPKGHVKALQRRYEELFRNTKKKPEYSELVAIAVMEIARVQAQKEMEGLGIDEKPSTIITPSNTIITPKSFK
jgi:hypothetical protein